MAPFLRKLSFGKSAHGTALRFVLFIGVLSFFADFTYEGSRSIVGPYLGSLGASAFVVATVAGAGELLGYVLRLGSGRLADSSGRYWPITIAGYVVQMASVPALALTGSWPEAAALIVLERIGKAIRNPPRDVMLSHAGRELGGFGWAFGLNEALDQAGALVGPLALAAVLAYCDNYRLAFGVLVVPAAINLIVVAAARLVYPRPQDMERNPPDVRTHGLPRVYWIYLAGAVLVGAGFADYPLIAFHLANAQSFSGEQVAVFYAVAMAVSGCGSLALGRLFDRRGFGVLVGLTLVSAAFAPLVFFGGYWAALIGVALWGLGMGVHESIIPAAVAPMVPMERRASAYGLFTAGYGVFWFLGSVLMGAVYSRSLTVLVVFCIVTQLAAIPLFIRVGRHQAPLFGQRAKGSS